MESNQNNLSLDRLESIAVIDILRDLICGLELYTHVLPGKVERGATPPEADPYDCTNINGNNRDSFSEELEYLPELEMLRRRLRTQGKSETNVSEPADADLDDEQLAESRKVHEDLDFLIQVIMNTKSELESRNSFNQLKKKVEEEASRLESESILESHLKSKEKDVKRLEIEIAEFEEESLKKEQEQMCQINNLKDQLHFLKQQGEADSRFVKVWLTARNEHERLGHKDEISAKSFHMKSIRTQITRDCDSYENVTAWTKLVSAKLEQKIRDWRTKSQSDIHTFEQRIEKKRKNIEEQQERIACLEATIGERMVELAPWDEEKAQERIQRLDYMRRYYSCRMIQRWWRLYMLSHGLYKKKKPKPKPNKSSNKRKKDK